MIFISGTSSVGFSMIWSAPIDTITGGGGLLSFSRDGFLLVPFLPFLDAFFGPATTNGSTIATSSPKSSQSLSLSSISSGSAVGGESIRRFFLRRLSVCFIAISDSSNMYSFVLVTGGSWKLIRLPIGPTGPESPLKPIGPGNPMGPGSPLWPFSPRSPFRPSRPRSPCGPILPGVPGGPGGPAGPIIC
uniref:Uncharacterized protein n=1 Tax=Phlebotomus papatasi TaxID=29031 RepID=A0A1B0GPN0_PHLPP